MRIALTGGIASGKSTVAQWFVSKGIPLIDCDALVHESYLEGGKMYLAVLDAFGPRILNGQGDIDRKALGEIVFSDAAALKLLSDITHPIVRELVENRAKAFEEQGNDLVVVDVPLLYESGMAAAYDGVIVVYVSPALQLSRLMSRNGFSEEEAQKRIAAQMSLSEKAALADYVITNEGELMALYEQLEALLKTLQSV